jgi:hypothetical protein
MTLGHQNCQLISPILLLLLSVAITAYIGLAAEFFTRFFSRKAIHHEASKPIRDMETSSYITLMDSNGTSAPFQSKNRMVIGMEMDTRMKFMIFGLFFSTLVIYVRSIYRTVELSDGWSGRIIQTQVYFSELLPQNCTNNLGR